MPRTHWITRKIERLEQRLAIESERELAGLPSSFDWELRGDFLTSEIEREIEWLKNDSPDYYEGVRIRTLPPGPEVLKASSPARGITATAEAVFDVALDELVGRLGSEATFDDRQNMGPDDFPERDEELEPVGSTQVAVDVDGIYISYIPQEGLTDRLLLNGTLGRKPCDWGADKHAYGHRCGRGLPQ